jgi:hypothetical protein
MPKASEAIAFIAYDTGEVNRVFKAPPLENKNSRKYF